MAAWGVVQSDQTVKKFLPQFFWGSGRVSIRGTPLGVHGSVLCKEYRRGLPRPPQNLIKKIEKKSVSHPKYRDKIEGGVEAI